MSKPYLIIVQTCDDCPLAVHDNEDAREPGVFCHHPSSTGDRNLTVSFGGPPPEWCPLRNKMLTIALEKVGS